MRKSFVPISAFMNEILMRSGARTLGSIFVEHMIDGIKHVLYSPCILFVIFLREKKKFLAKKNMVTFLKTILQSQLDRDRLVKTTTDCKLPKVLPKTPFNCWLWQINFEQYVAKKIRWQNAHQKIQQSNNNQNGFWEKSRCAYVEQKGWAADVRLCLIWPRKTMISTTVR